MARRAADKAKVLIGTSGFSYRHWRGGVFYPKGLTQKNELEFYARNFRTLELNNPFYRLPSREVFESWHERTPADFVFAVKASRFITHIRRLNDCEEPLKLLLEHAGGLRSKLGPVLFQLPPKAKPNLEVLEEFLKLLPKRHDHVFEFREDEWFNEAVYALLRRYHVALCIAVSPVDPEPEPIITGRFAYLRMHAGLGSEGEFTEDELARWSRVIERLRRDGTPSYVYFNNDWRGFAPRNAGRLRELLGIER